MQTANYNFPKGTVTRAMRLLKRDLNIRSREDFIKKFDDDATAKQFELIEGIGPVSARMLVRLRGASVDKWREVTHLPGFNDPHQEALSVGAGHSTPTPVSSTPLVFVATDDDSEDWDPDQA